MPKAETPSTTKHPVTIERPHIEVLERSLQNPFGLPSADVELIDGGFHCHWVNTELKGGDQLRYFLDAGYLKCRVDYLKHPEFVTFQPSPEGYVTRGARGAEVLMYTTIAHSEARLRKKQEENIRRMSDPNRSASDAANAASAKIGDQAAEYLSRHTRPVGTVSDTLERIEQVKTT